MTKARVVNKLAALGYGVVENIICPWNGVKVRFQTYGIAFSGAVSSFQTLEGLNRYADLVSETRGILGYTTEDLVQGA